MFWTYFGGGHSMTKVISVYSVQEGEGRTTIATTMAKLLGQANKNVLYVELDAHNPTFAHVTNEKNETKNTLNYLTRLANERKLSPSSFINKKLETKEFPKNIHFLTFPLDYEVSQLPCLVNEKDNGVLGNIPIQEFSESFITHFKQLDYDVVLFVLPHDISDLFAFPVMLQSDYVINVVTTNKKGLHKNLRVQKMLSDINEFDVKNKWKIVFNKYVSGIPFSVLDNLFPTVKNINDSICTVMNDNERISKDLTNEIGSTKIDEGVLVLLQELDVGINPQRRKGFFGVRSQ